MIRLQSYSCYLLQFDILFFRERHIASIHRSNTNYVPSANRNNDTRSILNQCDFLLKHNGVTMTSKHREKNHFHTFFFLVLSFVKQLLEKLEQTNFCVKRDKICLRQNIGSIRDSHACTRKSSRLSPLSGYVHLEQAPVIIIFIEIITIIWFFWIFAFSCYPFFSLSVRLISNLKRQEQKKNLQTLRTNS